MSTINTNIGNSGYYQLNNSSGNSSNGLSGTSSLASSLLQGTSSDNNSSVFSAAYLLDLSPEAQKYLAGTAQSQAGSNALGGTQSFILSADQRQTLNEILVRFKDEPFTQETYNKIQDALQQAGLSPQQLSMIDKATSFNPTQLLINALTGKNTGEEADVDGTKSQAKIDNYMQQLIGQWKSISTTVNASAQTTQEQTAIETDSSDDVSSDAVAAAGGASEG